MESILNINMVITGPKQFEISRINRENISARIILLTIRLRPSIMPA